MSRCFQLAHKGIGKVQTNPMVGAVIVVNDRIIGEGYHQKYGSAHAEINALNSITDTDRHLISSASLFVSLEPCNHHGKTPPCTDAIIQAGIKQVYISCTDPNIKVKGKGIDKLKENGIKVDYPIQEELGHRLIRPFAVQQKFKRPYIILKWAQSRDGYMGKEDESVWYTNSYSRSLVHKWRSEVNAILVGANTVLLDNPSLDVRMGFEGELWKVILDPGGKLLDKGPLKVFQSPGKLIHIHPENTDENWKVPMDENMLPVLLTKLYQKNIGSIIVEGGVRTTKAFIKMGLWDEARIFRTQKDQNEGLKAPSLSGKLVKKGKIVGDEWIIIQNPSV